MNVLDAPVRLLDAEKDLTACLDLAQSRAWEREEHKWRLLFDVGDVYGIDDPEDGGLAAATVCAPYGTAVSAISMVLVAARYERRGLGGRMMRHALERSGTASACLTATEYGRALYERLGFRATGACTTYIGELGEPGELPESAGPRVESRRAEPSDMPDVAELDAEVFGAPRTALLRRLPDFCADFRAVRDPAGGLTGFGGAWYSGDRLVVGPVTARDADTAIGLVEALTRKPGPVRLDVGDRHPELIAWAVERSLRPLFGTTVMEYGEPIGGDPSRLFVPVMQALG